MPFIKKERRPAMDAIFDHMIMNGVRADGDLNYILYKFCKYRVEPSYNNYKNFCGELRECVEQIERDFIAPYEERKRKENGDI
jgi:hypothetical protein